MKPLSHILPCAALFAAALPAAVMAQAQPSYVGGEVMFVSGSAQRLTDKGKSGPVAKGMQLVEGDRIRTQPDSHVYVRLRDGGLLVVRPASELHVDLWRYDPAQPQDSRIRYTLDNGVARHVSGTAAKAARDKFRFNTPMAAIGVRGTDFTVLANAAGTKVSVQSGGVIVNSLGNGCRAEGLGPCEGASAVELFASAKDRLVQLRTGERRAELVEDTSHPEKSRLAANGEPTSSRPMSSAVDIAVAEVRTSSLVDRVQAATGPAVEKPPVVIPDIAVASWGRYAALGDKDPATVKIDDILQGRSLVALNSAYVLAANKPATPFEMPGAGAARFNLAGHEGVITDKSSGASVATTASDGALNIDFGARRFDTTMNVKSGELATTIAGKGSVESNGRFISDSFISQSIIQGIVGGKNASEAVYLYQRSINDRYDASGVASWRR